MDLLIATRNVHKLRELRSILKTLGFLDLDIRTLLDFPSYRSPEEGETSFKENAEQKAVHAAKTLGFFTLADDSGLVVPVLDGKPGVRSSRFAGEKATDKENRQKLLKEMQNFQIPEQRQAYFECWIALADPEGLKKTGSGTCEGILLTEEKGGHGFGYDPLFLKHEYSKTFAEMDEEIKNRVSHRRKAVDKILPYLQSLVITT